jgi:hypothetical protein
VHFVTREACRTKGEASADIFGAIHAVKHAHELKGPAEAETRNAVRRHSRNVLACETDRSGIRTQHAGDEIKRRGLARSVRPQQPDDLAGLNRQIQRVDGDKAAKRPDQASDLENG